MTPSEHSQPVDVRSLRATSGLGELTNREQEVLVLLAAGLSDRGIGEKLWLTQKTVETHVRHILAKLALPVGSNHNRRVLAAVTYTQATSWSAS